MLPEGTMQGQSLLPAIEGVDLDLSVYSQSHNRNMASVRNTKFSFIKYGPHKKRKEREMLFDNRNDSLERFELSKADKDQRIKEELKQWQRENQELLDRLGVYTEIKKVQPDAQTVENLKSLGYLH